MVRSNARLRLTVSLVALCAGLGLQGCQAIREATGAIKTPPDEFTVLTKAPLVIPPDYNLRPPQPGIAARNEIEPDEQAQTALFAVSTEDQIADLGMDYSEGEKLLLSRTQALEADPMIRRTVNADAGEEDFGPAFASRLLYEGAKPPPPRIEQQPNGQYVAVGDVETEGFFGRNFGFLGFGGRRSATEVAQPVAQPVPQVIAQAPQAIVPQPIAVQAPRPVVVQAPQPVIMQAPQAVAVPQPPTVQAPQPVFVQAPAPVPVPVPQAAAPMPQGIPAPPPIAAFPQAAAPVEQPGWFTRNFIMSPQQRAALAAGQPVPPSVSQQLEAQRQQQSVQQQFYAAAPPPQVTVAPGQYAAPQVVIAQQPNAYQAVQTVPVRRAQPRNLYQYLFGTPQSAAVVTPVALPQAQSQPQQVIMVPVPAPQVPQAPQAPGGIQPAPAPVVVQPAPAPVIVQQPQAQPQPAPQKKGGIFDWLPF